MEQPRFRRSSGDVTLLTRFEPNEGDIPLPKMETQCISLCLKEQLNFGCCSRKPLR